MNNGLLKSIVAVTLMAVTGVVVVSIFVPDQAPVLSTMILGFAAVAFTHLVSSYQQTKKIERGERAAAIRAQRVVRKIDATSRENAKVIEEANLGLKTDLGSIHAAVNSNQEKLTERLASAEKQLLEVSKLLAASQTAQVIGSAYVLAPKSEVPIPVMIVADKDNPVPVEEVPAKVQGNELEQRK